MKISVTETIRKTVDMHFDKYIKVPKWVCEYDGCDNCNTQFDNEHFCDDEVIIAFYRDDHDFPQYKHYCLNCWKREEEPYIQAKEYKLSQEETEDSLMNIDKELHKEICRNLEYILYPEDLKTYNDHREKMEKGIKRYHMEPIFNRQVNLFSDCIMNLLKGFRFILKK